MNFNIFYHWVKKDVLHPLMNTVRVMISGWSNCRESGKVINCTRDPCSLASPKRPTWKKYDTFCVELVNTRSKWIKSRARLLRRRQKQWKSTGHRSHLWRCQGVSRHEWGASLKNGAWVRIGPCSAEDTRTEFPDRTQPSQAQWARVYWGYSKEHGRRTGDHPPSNCSPRTISRPRAS